MKPVCDALLDLFSNFFSFVFFLNCGYLICLTCKNNQKNYEREESEETKKKYIYIFNSKKEFVRIHSFMRSTKSLKFDAPLPPFPLYAYISNFDLSGPTFGRP